MKLRRILRTIVLVVLIVIVLSSVGFVIWANNPQPASAEVEALAFSDNPQLRVDVSRWIVFQPNATDTVTGLIFYPGAHVDPRAYAVWASEVAADGYLVVIVPMPLNFAVFDYAAADDVIATYPQIERWALGGHSLGGAMAARYVYDHPTTIDALILMGAYSDRDLSSLDLDVTVIYGTLDGLATAAEVEDANRLLPADAQLVAIEGGNHAQFGLYGAQSGDNPATIDAMDQQNRVRDAVVQTLRTITDAE